MAGIQTSQLDTSDIQFSNCNIPVFLELKQQHGNRAKLTYKKVKVFRYKPGVALGVPGSSDIRHCEGGKVVTITHRTPSPPGVFLVLILRD